MENNNKISILTKTSRGAKLISDGEKAAWVMGRQVREDGSLTAGARDALEHSTMTDKEARMLVLVRNGEEVAREQLEAERREKNKAKANAEVVVNVSKENWFGECGNAWKVKANTQMRGRYGNYFYKSAFLPKSKVVATPQPDGSVNITMPAWVLWHNEDMVYTKVS